MQYLGNTEISSPTPVIHIGCKYWVRSRTTGKVTLIECKPSLYSTKYGSLNIESRLRFERFDIFGPVVDEATQPDFDALKVKACLWVKDKSYKLEIPVS